MAGTFPILAPAPQRSPNPVGLVPAMSRGPWLRVPLLLVGLGAVALLWLQPSADPLVPTARTVPPAAQALADFARVLPLVSNGVVESIREVAVAGKNSARQFEMTIRMRDGTTRISQETGGARWRAGDPVRMIGS